MTKKLISIRGLTFLILLLLTVCYKAEAGVLDFRIKSIKFENATMKEALSALREYGIQVGLETVPLRGGEGEIRISNQLNNVRVKDILDYLISVNPRYTYEATGCNIINIYPKNAKDNPDDLLNIRIKGFEIHEYDLYNAIHHIDQLAPELKEYLQRKLKPAGVPGSIISGDKDHLRPKISLKLKNVTVRDILNKIAEESSKASSGNRDFPPIGWLYEFKVDGSSPIGGYPVWETF